MQVWVDLIFHVAGQETELFSGFYGGAAKDDFLDFFILQCAYGKGDSGICLSRTCRTDGKYHIILGKSFYQFQLVFASGDDGLSCDAEYNHVPGLLCLRGISFYNVNDNLFFQRVIFGTVLLKFGDIFFESTHFFLIAQHFDDIASGNYA